MRSIRTIGLTLATVFVVSVVTASAAMAADTVVFKYNAGGSKFEARNKLGVSSTLETVGGIKVTCTGYTSKGEMNGASPTGKVKNVTVSFTGCKSAGKKCNSEENTSETINTATLEGKLGMVTETNDVLPAAESDKAGLELKPEAPATQFADFDCGTTLDVEVEGCVIGEILPLHTAITQAATGTLKYQQSVGEQVWGSFVGGVTDECTLKSKINGGLAEEAGIETEAEFGPTMATGSIEIEDDPS
jgi:hypothetical protein